MTNETGITGELNSDMRFLLNEIRRVSKIFNDIKRRGLELEDELRKWYKMSLNVALKGEQMKSNYNLMKATGRLAEFTDEQPHLKERLDKMFEQFEFNLNAYLTEYKKFFQEINRVRKIIDRVRILLHAPDSLVVAENLLAQATVEIEKRWDAGKYSLSTIMYYFQHEQKPPEMISSYINSYRFHLEEINDPLLALNEATRQAMINVLRAYKLIYQKYPILKGDK